MYSHLDYISYYAISLGWILICTAARQGESVHSFFCFRKGTVYELNLNPVCARGSIFPVMILSVGSSHTSHVTCHSSCYALQNFTCSHCFNRIYYKILRKRQLKNSFVHVSFQFTGDPKLIHSLLSFLLKKHVVETTVQQMQEAEF